MLIADSILLFAASPDVIGEMQARISGASSSNAAAAASITSDDLLPDQQYSNEGGTVCDEIGCSDSQSRMQQHASSASIGERKELLPSQETIDKVSTRLITNLSVCLV